MLQREAEAKRCETFSSFSSLGVSPGGGRGAVLQGPAELPSLPSSSTYLLSVFSLSQSSLFLCFLFSSVLSVVCLGNCKQFNRLERRRGKMRE